MVKTSSSSENEACCSKSYKKNTDSLNSKITQLTYKLSDRENMLYHYKLCLSQVEGRLVEYKNLEVKYCKRIRGLELEVEFKTNSLECLTKKLETLKKEKEGLDGNLAGFQIASKDLDILLESQRLDKNKEGLGYSVVPPHLAQIYSPPKKDLSWTGLPEFADDTITDYSMPSPTIESTSNDVQNKNPSIIKTEASPSTISSKPFIKFVKAADRPTEDKTDKVETAKKPAVRYVEKYIKPSKKSTVRGNQRNWNNLKSQQLGENFVMKNKACFNCGDFDHLAYDCGIWVKKRRTCLTNSHKTISPRTVIHKPHKPLMRPVRPNMYVA
nr:ubiquitin hydrolase [Tanacetum cinerariifolium]